jgi:hypothetical protein
MTHQETEKLMHEAAGNGDWKSAANYASKLPTNWNTFSTLPSSGEMSDEGINHALDLMTHKHGHHNKDLPNFLFELSSNLPKNVSKETLNRIADLGKEDQYVTQNVTSHPNFSLDDKASGKKRAADFWSDYEKKVKPEHFATISAMHSGKENEVVTHRGQKGSSKDHAHLIPDIRNHAKDIQNHIMQDGFISKKTINGEPHIQLHRGVNGNYGKKIREAAEWNPKTGTAKRKNLSVPSQAFSSWTTDPEMANRFMWGRGDIAGQAHNAGAVMSKWVPVKDVLHSGFHTNVVGQEHPHQHENEIVVGHPEKKLKVHTKEMTFQPDTTHGSETHDPKYGSAVKPVMTKSESATFTFIYNYDTMIEDMELNDLKKGIKSSAISLATAAAMSGMPFQTQQPQADMVPHQQAPMESIGEQHNDRLDSGLKAISYIESSNRTKAKHKEVDHGLNAGTSGIGKYGLMPLQVIDAIDHDPSLRSKNRDLASLDPKIDQDALRTTLENNPNLQDQIATSHWHRLGQRFDHDENKMAYAWLHGITGTLHATDDQINNHPYVQKYHSFLKTHQSLNSKPKKMHKSEYSQPNKDATGFEPLEDYPVDRKAVNEINDFLRSGTIHSLGHVGHFTNKSFIAGVDGNSWLIKLEPTNRSSIKSAKYGLQVVKEAVFYETALKVFDLSEYTPRAIIGDAEVGQQKWPAVAIRMYSGDYTICSQVEKQSPGTMIKILDKYLKNGTLHKLATMLYINGEADCHGSNCMTNGDDFKIIDHGTAFADESFNPGKDPKIFTPYFLRVGRVKQGVSDKEKLEKMPLIKDPNVHEMLRHWVLGLDPEMLSTVICKYNSNPRPELMRLKLVQSLVAKGARVDQAINELWAKGFEFPIGDKK